jgi:unspecific monooxygenase
MLLLAILISVPILVLGLLLWRSRRHQKRYQSLYRLPSPPRNWFLGNIPQLLQAIKQKQFFRLLADWSQAYGPTYLYWIGRRQPVLVLSQPAVIEQTIIHGMQDGSLVRTPTANRAWNDISGPILVGQSGDEWQWRRKAWNPEFSPSALSKYVAPVQAACSQVTEKIRATEGDSVAVDPLFVELTMRVIASLLLGIPVDPQAESPEGPPLEVEKTYQAMSVLGYRFLRVATGEQRWRKYLPTPAARDYWAARRHLEAFLGPRVDLALQLRDTETSLPDTVSPAFRESMLVKIAAKEPLYTREFLIAECIELLIAGTDTTAHTLSFAVGELAAHPDIFAQAQGLVDQVWKRHGELTLASLKELNYLRAIAKETLRLYSVASGSTSLEAIRPTQVAGIDVPTGTKVFWSMLGAGRDAATYPEPEKFLPDRWLAAEQGGATLPMVHFGSGAHRCLGEHLSLLEATLMLAQLLRHFRWELVNGRASLENLQQNLLIYPVDGMPLRFQLRSPVVIASVP